MPKIKIGKKPKSGPLDNILFFSVLILLVFGVIMVYDVSVVYAEDVFGGKFYFLILQSIWAALGLIGFFIFLNVDYHVLARFATPLFIISIFLLVFVLLKTPFTPIIYGARRWIFINPEPFPTLPIVGRVSLQPSEFIKLSSILYFALFFSKREKKVLIPFTLVLAVLVGLILFEPDFGTSILVSSVSIIMFFASGANILYFLLGLPLSLVLSFVFILSSGYRRARLLTYLNPENSDSLGAGYHINQILIALGSGGFFGLGFGGSRQKYQYIPEVATDSIFAVIGEELGFIGLAVLISLFLIVIYRGFKIARKAPDKFGKLLAIGITSWFACQTFINLSAMVHLIPLTGIPLPLISYGGSSMIFTLVGLGILLNVSRS